MPGTEPKKSVDAVRLVAETGEIQLPGCGTPIGPALDRATFLGSELGRSSRPVVDADPRRTYSLAPVAAFGTEFLITLYFTGDRLSMVELMDGDPEFGVGRAQWSEEKERARAQRHAAWLRDEWKLAPGRHAWGTLESGYDPHSEESFILLRYEPAGA